MARGESTEHHPNRKVSRENFMSGPPAGWTMNNMVKGLVGQSDDAQGWMDDPSKAPYINRTPATFSPETLKEFGIDQQDGPLCNNCSDDMGEALEWHDRESIHPSKRVPCVGCGAK